MQDISMILPNLQKNENENCFNLGGYIRFIFCESPKKRDNLTKNLLDMAFNKLNKDIPVKVASRFKLQEQKKFDEQLGVNTDS